jgi:putrescine aminotransferase
MTGDTDPREIARLYRRHLNRGFALLLGGRAEVEANGTRIRGADGAEYLDCGSYAVFLLGHRHPDVVAAVIRQIQTQPLASGLLLSPPRARAAEALAGVAPEGLEHVVFTNSGAEASELAIKLARLSGRTRLVTMEGAFHGMTTGALSVAGNPLYAKLLDPLLPGVDRVPFGDIEALDAVLARAEGEACVFCEPLQGEAGVILPPDGYLSALSRCCRERGALLVFDEIQCGLGRGGWWWQAERAGVTPDVLLTGKVLGGGVVPAGAAITSDEVFGVMDRDPFLHGSTFAGSPTQAAAVMAALDVLSRDGLVDVARSLGEELREQLRVRLQERWPGLVDKIRGLGLLIGIEFSSPKAAGEYVVEMLDRHVITLPCTTNTKVVRLTPAAIVDDADIQLLLDANEEVGRVLADRHLTQEAGT